MTTVLVVVSDVRVDEVDQMVPAEDDDVVEQLAAQGPDPPFGHRILPRTSIRRAVWLHAQCLHELHDRWAEDRVSIED